MIISGGVRFTERGLKASIRAMQVQTQLVTMTNENITGFDKIGFQRKEPVVSSFTEFLGVDGLSQTVDDQVGRITFTEKPLDVAISEKGYFQIQTAEGVKLTRDGRFKIDKEGNLLTLENDKVLSAGGSPIVLPIVPEKLTEIKIDSKGQVSVYNKKTNKLEAADRIGVVDSNGRLVNSNCIKQGYLEYSNVSLASEFMSLLPVLKAFDGNRQLFMIQNQNLQRVIQQLGQS
jgi:flagellar basal body rod protein FlgG